MLERLRTISQDPRHFQILTLGSLLCFLFFFYDFAPAIEIIPFVVGTCLLTQYVFTKVFKLSHFDFRSPFITSLSLCLLFKASVFLLYPIAALLAIGSKFVIRYEGKHIFNPANFGIVALLFLAPDMVWISPGQWGSALWLALALAAFATLVLLTARRGDMTIFFLLSWVFFVFGRALWLGDPLSIPLLSMQSGALLIFAFFMISDPKSTPDHIVGRALFTFVTAGIAYTLQYHFQIREGLFYALFFMSMTTPLIDSFFKSQRYQWRQA
ncbi:MAG: RnfABCDGE type electron transport complex subunit D [Alphaproteobacteria bacterium]|nr:RnfABCDGE type electron transport complex subunit D [Alphaproteobacteria bacterium]